jgi:hypothetical protein
MVTIAAAATVARAAVYGSGSSLGGYVLLSAFSGGVALAFSPPFLLVLVPYLAVLFAEPKSAGSAAPKSYLAAFALAFVVAISGLPSAVATPIHRSESLVDLVGGAIFLVWGLLAALGFVPGGVVPPATPVWGRVAGAESAAALGASTGALMYHELDPVYDSVFFFTANAVAASHAPLTVAVFTTGLGLIYLAAGSTATAMTSRVGWGRRVLAWGRPLLGIATTLIGVAILTRRFGAVRTLLF